MDADRIAIGGASAGGGLAAALAFLARDRGKVKPSCRCCPTRCSTTGRWTRPWTSPAAGCGTPRATGSAGRRTSAGPTRRRRFGRRDDLAGLAPAWLGVGTLDLFRDEDLAYAQRLNDAGVPCEVHEVPGAFHGFDGLLPKASVSQAYFDSTCAALGRALRQE